MSSINVGRVVTGGLLAGLVVNISETVLNLVVVAQPMDEALKARSVPPVSDATIGGFVVFAFLLGIATVWLYAAIRPRFGPGVQTAVLAGVAVWFFAYLYGAVGIVLLGMLPAALMTIVTLWGLPEIVIASVAGAWLYREE